MTALKRLGRLCLALTALVCLLVLPAGADGQEAQEVPIQLSAGGGKLLDGSYSTSVSFDAGTTLTVTAADGQSPIHGLYLVWARQPGPWTLTAGGQSSPQGEHGFLHEYVPIEGGALSADITLSQAERLCCIQAYSAGTLPPEVQVWEPPCRRADLLLFSTHADDEILFFGGALAEYAGERGLDTQLVYFSNYFNGAVIREHEKLDGLWTCGVRSYPVNAPFDDVYAADLDQAKSIYDYDQSLSFLVEQIRRFQPQICIAQDVNGEYGHGTHMLTSQLMRQAVEVSMDPAVCPESAQQYGTWDVPKTYLHLYPDGPLTLDCRKSLDAFGGKSALEVATEAYKKHVSQQWCWFYVSDDYEYSIAEYGLYRTTVGPDTGGGDMMEHLVSYAEQERLEAQRKAEEEAKKAQAERERRAQEEARRQAQAQAEEEARQAAERAQRLRQALIWALTGAGVAAVLVLGGLALHRRGKRKRRHSGRRQS